MGFAFARLVQFGQHAFHTGHGIGHRGDHVVHERRVVPVFFGIGHQQRQLCHHVLEIMHHEGRQAVGGLELARADQCLDRLLLYQKGRHLYPRGLQDVVVLPGTVLRGQRFHQQQDPCQILFQYQRHYHPGIRSSGQPLRKYQPGIAAGILLEFVQVDHPLPRLQEAHECIVLLQIFHARLAHGVVGHEFITPVALLPQYAPGTIHDIGHDLDGLSAPPGMPAQGRELADETQPFVAVVVLVVEKMLVQKDPQIGPDMPGGKHHEQDEQGPGHEGDLQHPAPGAAVVADVIPPCGHQQQIDTGGQQGHAMEDHLA